MIFVVPLLILVLLWLAVRAAVRALFPGGPVNVLNVVLFALVFALLHADYAWVHLVVFPTLEREYGEGIVNRRVQLDGVYDQFGLITSIVRSQDPVEGLLIENNVIQYIELDVGRARLTNAFLALQIDSANAISPPDRPFAFAQFSVSPSQNGTCSQLLTQDGLDQYRTSIGMPTTLCPMIRLTSSQVSQYTLVSQDFDRLEAVPLFNVSGVRSGLREISTGDWITECVQYFYRPWASRLFLVDLVPVDMQSSSCRRPSQQLSLIRRAKLPQP